MRRAQREAIAGFFARLSSEAPLIEPEWAPPESGADTGDQSGAAGGENVERSDAIADAIRRETGLVHATGPASTTRPHAGWLGLACPNVAAAVWLMRALVVHNVLARREETTLFVPINRRTDPDAVRVRESVAYVHRLAQVRGVV
jgi:hypothetical protein